MSAALQELLQLPVEERIEAINVLWDSIHAEREQRLDPTDEERAELDRRLDAYEQDPTGNLTLSEIIQHVRNSR